MPHIEVKYSDNLTVNFDLLFDEIEKIINELDPTAGACISHAYPASFYKYQHCLINVHLLTKDYRDGEFSNEVIRQVKTAAATFLPKEAQLAISIFYTGEYYFRDSVKSILDEITA